MFWFWNYDIIYDIEWVLLSHDNNKPNPRTNVTGYLMFNCSTLLDSFGITWASCPEGMWGLQPHPILKLFSVHQVTPAKYPISITDCIILQEKFMPTYLKFFFEAYLQFSFFWTFRFLLIINWFFNNFQLLFLLFFFLSIYQIQIQYSICLSFLTFL